MKKRKTLIGVPLSYDPKGPAPREKARYINDKEARLLMKVGGRKKPVIHAGLESYPPAGVSHGASGVGMSHSNVNNSPGGSPGGSAGPSSVGSKAQENIGGVGANKAGGSNVGTKNAGGGTPAGFKGSPEIGASARDQRTAVANTPNRTALIGTTSLSPVPGVGGFTHTGGPAIGIASFGDQTSSSLQQMSKNVRNWARTPAEGIAMLARNLGWSGPALAGILGRLGHESTMPGFGPFDPNAYWGKPSEKSYGLAQWRDKRLDDLNNYADQMGMPISDPALQMSFFNQEMRHNPKYSGAYDALTHATTPEEGVAAMNAYERPKGYVAGKLAQLTGVWGTKNSVKLAHKYAGLTGIPDNVPNNPLSVASAAPTTSLIGTPPIPRAKPTANFADAGVRKPTSAYQPTVASIGDAGVRKTPNNLSMAQQEADLRAFEEQAQRELNNEEIARNMPARSLVNPLIGKRPVPAQIVNPLRTDLVPTPRPKPTALIGDSGIRKTMNAYQAPAAPPAFAGNMAQGYDTYNMPGRSFVTPDNPGSAPPIGANYDLQDYPIGPDPPTNIVPAGFDKAAQIVVSPAVTNNPQVQSAVKAAKAAKPGSTTFQNAFAALTDVVGGLIGGPAWAIAEVASKLISGKTIGQHGGDLLGGKKDTSLARPDLADQGMSNVTGSSARNSSVGNRNSDGYEGMIARVRARLGSQNGTGAGTGTGGTGNGSGGSGSGGNPPPRDVVGDFIWPHYSQEWAFQKYPFLGHQRAA